MVRIQFSKNLDLGSNPGIPTKILNFMIAIGILIICYSFFGAILLSVKIADFHHKIKETDAPLHIYYVFLIIPIWAGLMFEVVHYLKLD